MFFNRTQLFTVGAWLNKQLQVLFQIFFQFVLSRTKRWDFSHYRSVPHSQ